MLRNMWYFTQFYANRNRICIFGKVFVIFVREVDMKKIKNMKVIEKSKLFLKGLSKNFTKIFFLLITSLIITLIVGLIVYPNKAIVTFLANQLHCTSLSYIHAIL